MNVILQTNDPDAYLGWLDIKRHADAGMGDWFNGRLHARASGFAGEAPFSCGYDELSEFAADVRSLDQTLLGTARLEPLASALMFVELKIDHAGVIHVHGEIVQYQDSGTQRLEFAIRTDQTCLGPLGDALQQCLHAPAS